MDGEEYSLTHSSASDDEVCFYWASWSIILEWRLYWKHKHYLLNYLLNHMVTSSIIPQSGIQKNEIRNSWVKNFFDGSSFELIWISAIEVQLSKEA